MSAELSAAESAANLESLYDMLLNGGPVMIPIALCSVVALAYTVERWVRLRPARLGTARFGRDLIAAVKSGGAASGETLCTAKPNPMSRILGAGLKRMSLPRLEMEKAVEDAGAREVKRLSANLRPLVVVGMIAPLLGLLGTVWGMIEAFSQIAQSEGLGKPELLAGGISQALITTAAGLAIAIPAQAAYFYFRSRIDRFIRQTEDVYAEISDTLLAGPAAQEAAA